ncbi:hypothetical protein [Bradyrhizobium erythrophlei]|nr:hypothetical protein [Bradyrhizobium erythrophlei]
MARMVRAINSLEKPTAQRVELAKEAAIDCERRVLPLVVSKDDERSEADELLDRCEPDNWRDENGRPLKSEIAKMLAIHMGSIPMPSNIGVAVFTRVLLDDVMALEPSFFILESACRELRTTKDWHPSIAEVIAAIKKQRGEWCERLDAVECIEGVYAELVEAIAEAEAQLATEEERRIKAAAERRRAEERKAAKSQPLVVGDRVRTVDHGTGTVLEIVPIHRFYVEYLVRFDTTSLWHLSAAYFERLIAGDEGYEPPALPMIEHKPSLPMEPITLTDHETC